MRWIETTKELPKEQACCLWALDVRHDENRAGALRYVVGWLKGKRVITDEMILPVAQLSHWCLIEDP